MRSPFFIIFAKKIVPKLKLFIPAFIWAVVIFILLVMPNNDIPSGGIFNIPNFDKLVHAGIFGMQVLLTALPFFRSKYASLSLFIKITIGVILYGVVMEFVQKYCTADRDYDTWDMVADAVGAILSCIFTNILYKMFLRKHKVI